MDGKTAIKQPTIFLDLTAAETPPAVPDDAHLPDRSQVEIVLLEQALQPLLEESRREREREVATISRHIELSLNTIINRENLLLAEMISLKEAGSTEPGLEGRIKISEDKLLELDHRLQSRRRELEQERQCSIGDIQHIGRTWVLPHPERAAPGIAPMVSDPEIERIAVQAVIAHEEAEGRVVESVEADNRGFDLISRYFELPGSKENVFYVYAIRCADDTIYIGQTDNLERRWNEHRQGQGAEWTAIHGVRYVLDFVEVSRREDAVETERNWKSGSGRERLKRKLQDRHLPAGRQVDVRFIEVKGRAHTGEIALTSNEYKTAQRLANDYWLYVVFHCATPNPTVNILRNPATLDWQPIVKVEHYRLKADSIRQPVELREDRAAYRTEKGDEPTC
jgi:predicted GIY-YIG superfamily endonuclease